MSVILRSRHLSVVDLGRISYADALSLQRIEHERVVAARAEGGPMTVFVLEHAPAVVTVTKRPLAASHVLASDQLLAHHGIERVETDRGGDVTYHGPGQLVVYPILDLERLGLRVHPYVRFLEQCIMDVLQEDGIQGMRDATATGVWVGERGQEHESRVRSEDRKIAAIGIRLSRFVSLHGFALNVAPDLAHFSLIVPCGLTRPVTSMQAELGARTPSIECVKSRVAAWFLREVEQRVTATARLRSDETAAQE